MDSKECQAEVTQDVKQSQTEIRQEIKECQTVVDQVVKECQVEVAQDVKECQTDKDMRDNKHKHDTEVIKMEDSIPLKSIDITSEQCNESLLCEKDVSADPVSPAITSTGTTDRHHRPDQGRAKAEKREESVYRDRLKDTTRNKCFKKNCS